MPQHELARAVDLSENSKTGPLSVTYASQHSCPPTCPLRRNGCYAEHGPMGIHTRRLNQLPSATPLEVAQAEAREIESKISGRFDLRLHVVGDCPTNEAAAIVSTAALTALRRGRRAYSYTHAWRTVNRAAWGDVSVLASCETPAEAIEAMERGYAAALVVPNFQEERRYLDRGVKVLPCPNQTRGVRCVDCRLCFSDRRLHTEGLVIGFETHGSRFKKVAALINNLRGEA